jgi:HEAT repeat protein
VVLPDDRTALAKLMESDDLEIAYRATQKLDRLHGASPLLELVGSGGTQTRWLAAAALEAHPSAETRNALLRALGDESPQVRSKAVIALRSMCDRNCVAQVEPLLADADETVRVVAGATLREIKVK